VSLDYNRVKLKTEFFLKQITALNGVDEANVKRSTHLPNRVPTHTHALSHTHRGHVKYELMRDHGQPKGMGCLRHIDAINQHPMEPMPPCMGQMCSAQTRTRVAPSSLAQLPQTG
jgi:hypothetical protein